MNWTVGQVTNCPACAGLFRDLVTGPEPAPIGREADQHPRERRTRRRLDLVLSGRDRRRRRRERANDGRDQAPSTLAVNARVEGDP
jgi:hypothetical protein